MRGLQVSMSTRALGAAGAVLVWLGWFAVSPALGLPTIATAAMLNRILVPSSNPTAWVGWTTLTAALIALVALYGIATTRRWFRPGIPSGVIFGIAAWAVAGAALMPLFGAISPAIPPPPLPPGAPQPLITPDPMQPTFMMLSLGPLAPVSALIAWVLFGVVLGSMFGSRSEEPSSTGAPSQRLAWRAAALRLPVALPLVASLLVLAGGVLVAATRATDEQTATPGATRVLSRGEVPALPEGPVFVSAVELRQAAGATLGPHSHVPGFTYALACEATLAFEEGSRMRLEPGDAGFTGGLVVHSHANAQGRVPAGVLAGALFLLVVVLALLTLRRQGRRGAVAAALTGLLVAGGVLAIINPWENDWLFIGIRPESARGAPMPLPDAARIYESPNLVVDPAGPYEESLAVTAVGPHERVRVASVSGPTMLLVLEGEAELRLTTQSPVRLDPLQGSLIQEGPYEVVNRGGGILHLLAFTIAPMRGAA